MVNRMARTALGSFEVRHHVATLFHAKAIAVPASKTIQPIDFKIFFSTTPLSRQRHFVESRNVVGNFNDTLVPVRLSMPPAPSQRHEYRVFCDFDLN